MGRFTQVDPFPGVLALPATQHPYQYALNNPLRYTDPSGEFVLPAGLALVAAAGFLAGVLYDAAQQYQEHGWACYNPWQGLLAGLTGAAIAGATALTAVSLLYVGGFALQGLGVWLSGTSLGLPIWAASVTKVGLWGGTSLTALGLSSASVALMASSWLWTGQVFGTPFYSGPKGGYYNQRTNDLNWGLGSQERKTIQDLLASDDYLRPSWLIGAEPELRETAKYIYVIDLSGTIWTARAAGVHHPDLVNGGNVMGAGELYINSLGRIVRINNQSGHYQPPSQEFFRYMQHLLSNLGIEFP